MLRGSRAACSWPGATPPAAGSTSAAPPRRRAAARAAAADEGRAPRGAARRAAGWWSRSGAAAPRGLDRTADRSQGCERTRRRRRRRRGAARGRGSPAEWARPGWTSRTPRWRCDRRARACWCVPGAACLHAGRPIKYVGTLARAGARARVRNSRPRRRARAHTQPAFTSKGVCRRTLRALRGLCVTARGRATRGRRYVTDRRRPLRGVRTKTEAAAVRHGRACILVARKWCFWRDRRRDGGLRGAQAGHGAACPPATARWRQRRSHQTSPKRVRMRAAEGTPQKAAHGAREVGRLLAGPKACNTHCAYARSTAARRAAQC